MDEVRMEDIHEPQTVPDGRWIFQVTKGDYRDAKSNHPRSPKKEGFFMIRAVEPVEVEEDVDVDVLATIFHKIPEFEPADRWNIKKFCLNVGLTESEMSGASLGDAVIATKGRMFEANVLTTQSEGSEYKNTKLSGFAAYENGAMEEIAQ